MHTFNLHHHRVLIGAIIVSGSILAGYALHYLPLPVDVHEFLRHALQLIFIGMLAWVAVACLDAVEDILMRRYDISQADNVQARRVHTQMQVLRRVAFILIVILTIGMMLYSFDNKLAKYGAGLLAASAGLPAWRSPRRQNRVCRTFLRGCRSPSASRSGSMMWW